MTTETTLTTKLNQIRSQLCVARGSKRDRLNAEYAATLKQLELVKG